MTDPEPRNPPQDPLLGPRAPALAAFLGRYARLLIVLFLVGSAIFHPARLLLADLVTPLPRDLTPGRVFEAPAYAAAPGCPIRRWSAGEYLPPACLAGNAIPDADAPTYGLETPRHVGVPRQPHRRRGAWSGYRQRQWARAGADALLLTGPPYASSLVVRVIAGRFAASPSKASGAAPPGTDYRIPPEDYRVAVRGALGFIPVVLLAFAAMLSLSMLYDAVFKRRRR